MKLITISLKNFRQYENENVDFSIDSKSNVTLIIGEVGSGKSTLEQAFKYVLYNKVNFPTSILLNSSVAKRMPINQQEEVSVSLKIEYKEKLYLIKRSISYLKKPDGSFSAINPKLNGWNIVNGNNVVMDGADITSLISEIIPEKLSEYFFLDGEKVDALKDSLNNLGKKNDFKEVVTRILGLEYFNNAITHISRDKKSVLKILAKDIDTNGDKTLLDLNNQLESLSEEIINKQEKKQISQEAIDTYESQIDKLENIIKSIPDATELFKRYKTLEVEIDSATTSNIEKKYSFTKINNYNFTNYLSLPLLKYVTENLINDTKIDYGIPELNVKTIEYIQKTGKCICGEEINSNDEHFKHLENLKDILPPRSMGTIINNFLRKSKDKINSSNGFFDNVDILYKQRRAYLSSIEEMKREFKQLDGLFEQLENIEQKKIDLDKAKENLRKRLQEKETIIKEIGNLESRSEILTSQIDELRAKSSTNKEKLDALNLAKKVSEKMNAVYSEKEKTIRFELQEKVNELEKSLYKEGIKVLIDDKYFITTVIEDSGYLDKSMGQNNSIIFAFIGSVIELAKKSTISDEGENLSKEFYPLVLDAPLSVFGLEVISNFCKVMPSIAEQLILFVNDRDGELIKKYMNSKIGKEYFINPINLIESKIEVKNV